MHLALEVFDSLEYFLMSNIEEIDFHDLADRVVDAKSFLEFVKKYPRKLTLPKNTTTFIHT